MTKKPVGWKGDSLRHSLAARGFTTSPPKGTVVDLTGETIETFADMKRVKPVGEEEAVRNAERLVDKVINSPEIKPILDRAESHLDRDDFWFLMEELSFQLLDVALELDVAVDGMISPSDREAGVKAAKPIIGAIKKANNWRF